MTRTWEWGRQAAKGERGREGPGAKTASILSDLGNHQHLQLIRNAINTAICFLKLNKTARKEATERESEMKTERDSASC